MNNILHENDMSNNDHYQQPPVHWSPFHDMTSPSTMKEMASGASVCPCDDYGGEQKITVDTEVSCHPQCGSARLGTMVEEKEGSEAMEEKSGHLTMRNPQYWHCVKEFQKLFESFGAKHLSQKTSNLDMIKSVLRENPGEEPFYTMDISHLVRQYLQWKQLLPRVKPFYAVKCNDSPVIVQVLGALGMGFDCASKKEIETVMEHGGKLAKGSDCKVDPASRIIFANPCKQISHCRHAESTGVEMTTVDNDFELTKIKKHWPNAKIVIRIKTDDSQSICQFSSKFGANVANGEVESLIQLCQELELDLYGVSFHVGSGCQSEYSFVDALVNVRKVFDMASNYGFNLRLVDIGGGFPGTDGDSIDFIDIANTIRPVIDQLFDDSVQVIAEPGRYFACGGYSLVCNVFAKRNSKMGPSNVAPAVAVQVEGKKKLQPEVLYYINDGLYGSFNCIYFDHMDIDLKHLPVDNIDDPAPPPAGDKLKRLSTVFGPTCDSIDKVIDCEPLPEMDTGDYVYVENFGAYTCAAGSAFNGFKTDTVHYFWRND